MIIITIAVLINRYTSCGFLCNYLNACFTVMIVLMYVTYNRLNNVLILSGSHL